MTSLVLCPGVSLPPMQACSPLFQVLPPRPLFSFNIQQEVGGSPYVNKYIPTVIHDTLSAPPHRNLIPTSKQLTLLIRLSSTIPSPSPSPSPLSTTSSTAPTLAVLTVTFTSLCPCHQAANLTTFSIAFPVPLMTTSSSLFPSPFSPPPPVTPLSIPFNSFPSPPSRDSFPADRDSIASRYVRTRFTTLMKGEEEET